PHLHTSFPTRRSSDLADNIKLGGFPQLLRDRKNIYWLGTLEEPADGAENFLMRVFIKRVRVKDINHRSECVFFKHQRAKHGLFRSEEHTSELQSRFDL